MKKLFLSFLFLTLFSCATHNQNTLTIVHFNDIYQISPPDGSKHSRLAQTSTIIKELRKNNSPVITTLGGDFLSPSIIGTAQINGKPIAGQQMVDILNSIDLDWAVLGNHEFDLSEEQFLQRLSEIKFHILASNVTDKNDQIFPNTQTSKVLLVKLGNRILKIGLIGITIDSNLKSYVKYKKDIIAAKAAIAELGKVDMIIALTHLSLERDQKLVEEIPQIDLILGGHEHENWLIYRGENLTPIIKADSDLKTLSIIKLSFISPNSRPQISANLKKIDDAIIADPLIEKKVADWDKIASDYFIANGFEPEKIIANISKNLDGRRSQIRYHATNLTDLVNEALRKESGPVDVAFFNSGIIRFDDILKSGLVTQKDIINIFSYGGKVVSANINGLLLNKILNLGTAKYRATSLYLHTSGVVKNGNKWFINKKPLDPNKEYFVAMNDFLLNYLPGGAQANLNFSDTDNSLIKNIKEYRDIRKIMIDAVASKYPFVKH